MTRDVVLLLALPASGKSEIRRYLDHAGPGALADLGVGRPVHLDDYPYVHLMRRISGHLTAVGEHPVFFTAPDEPFCDPRDWSTLTLLLDDDARLVLGGGTPSPEPPSGLFARLDRARIAAGPGPLVKHHALLERALAPEAAAISAGIAAAAAVWRPTEATLLMEFARGGPAGAEPPLEPPRGYRHSLSLLSPSILERAAVLYVWVTPGESRRRNAARARPGPEGDASILHHGVPERVMLEDYGCDDMAWLLDSAAIPGTIEVGTPQGVFVLPAARVDNRDDLTSHLRGDPADWDPAATAELHRRLREALALLRNPRWDHT